MESGNVNSFVLIDLTRVSQTALEVRSPHSSHEEGVSGEDKAIHMKAHASRRMPGVWRTRRTHLRR